MGQVWICPIFTHLSLHLNEYTNYIFISMSNMLRNPFRKKPTFIRECPYFLSVVCFVGRGLFFTWWVKLCTASIFKYIMFKTSYARRLTLFSFLLRACLCDTYFVMFLQVHVTIIFFVYISSYKQPCGLISLNFTKYMLSMPFYSLGSGQSR